MLVWGLETRCSGPGRVGWGSLASLLQPKISSATFWNGTPRSASPANRPYSISGEGDPEVRAQRLWDPSPACSHHSALPGFLGMWPPTRTSYVLSVSRFRGILRGPTGRWVRAPLPALEAE